MESSFSGHFALMVHITDLPHVSSDSTTANHTCENFDELTAKVDRYREHNEDRIKGSGHCTTVIKGF